MVGVPGKYRGCETCRSRRVKCGNERPICKRCADSHRNCTYERETVFIVASIEDGGRCSSHPPRKTAKKGKAASKPPEEKLELVVEEPLIPAWTDPIRVSNLGKKYSLQITALHTHLQSVVRSPRDDDSDDGSSRSAPLLFTPYEMPDVQPSLSEADFQVRSKAMVHFSPADDSQGDAASRPQADGIFLFLYEHNNSIASSMPPWRDPNSIRQQGPEKFRSFPHHHFFVRVYRHNAINTALFNRKPTFLAEPPWITAPWESHPKSLFDRLLDVVVLLPSILHRADRIVPQEQTLARRLMAQDLLANCIHLESQFDAWFAAAATTAPPPLPIGQDFFWIADPGAAEPQIPFADPFGFGDGLTATAFIYYWMAQLLFYPCVERLYWTIFAPIVDGPFPQTVPVLPGALQINPLKYARKEVGFLASNICRALDFALRMSVQPDILVGPLTAVCQFYQQLGLDGDGQGGGDEDGLGFGDGRLELMWCEGFRARLVTKAREMQEVIQGKRWRDVATF